MKLAVAAIVKDEIDSLAEWIAFHRMIGADYFLIADNGSRDGTLAYLQALQDERWLQVVSVNTPADEAPQLVAYRRLAALCPQWVDLIAFIDADEYLLPLPAEGAVVPRTTLHAWLDRRFLDPDVGAVTMNWACFGSSGERFKKEGLVIERFQRRALKAFGPNHHYKSIVRRTALKQMVNPHHPELTFGRLVNARGEAFDYRLTPEGRERQGLSSEVVWEEARLNHYMVKSVEEFVLKKARRGSASKVGYHKTAEYFERHDKNDDACSLAAELGSRVNQELRHLEAIAMVGQRLERGAPKGRQAKRGGPGLFGRRRREETPLRGMVIDSPGAAQPARMEGGETLVTGWLFLREAYAELSTAVRLVVRWSPEFELKHALGVRRDDVLAHYGHDDRDSHPQRCCGFRFHLPLEVTSCELELELGQQRWPLQRLVIERREGDAPPASAKVYQGQEDWLFLRADANLSGAQHRGQLLLTHTGIEQWRDYFSALSALAALHGVSHRVLVVPSKEAVLESAYGVPRAALTAVDQVLQQQPAGAVLYPVEELKALGEHAFYRTDTHWTHRGAMQATVALAESLGLERSAVEALFARDRYRAVSHQGDLGGKLEPPRSRRVDVLHSFSNAQLKVYDNGVPNFGRLAIFDNDAAPVDGVLLLCGASSSAGMFNYLARLFSRVIFVHTAGNLDPSLLAAFTPDYLVMQTTARFAIRPPTTAFSLEQTLCDKIDRLDDREIEAMLKKHVVSAEGTGKRLWERWEVLYQDRVARRQRAPAANG
ncbi:glycosyltransferase family 2 protein [Kushneria aurantia]|uniref:Glycosyltransferase family 2 protein n=1 Tax=Kushneria aurantia TaxID=504092 RepID=A0ABV6FYW5_9GAMM|nr:glycosyltransferase family 2 protein [Kushneria aurantia]